MNPSDPLAADAKAVLHRYFQERVPRTVDVIRIVVNFTDVNHYDVVEVAPDFVCTPGGCCIDNR